MFRQRLVAFVTIAALGVAAAACGSDDTSGGEQGPTGSDTAETVEGTTTDGSVGTSTVGDGTTGSGDESPGEFDKTATLRIAYTVGPSRFDPHRASSSFDNTSLFLTYDRLVHQDVTTGDAIPGLAESWEFSEDGSVLSMKLREGVTFHDGEPFNAEAVKANIERGQTIDQSAVMSELAIIESVEVVDEYDVDLKLNDDGASLPLVLSDRPGMMLSPAAFDNPDLDVAPVGAGMYTVKEYNQDARILYEAYPDYWDPDAVGAAAVEFLIQVDSVTRLNAIRSGQLDWTFVDPPQAADAESANLEVLDASSLAFYHMQLNRSFEPFSNPLVREALNHAVNRDAIVDGLLLGYGEAGIQPFPKGYFAYDESTDPDLYAYDPDMAKSLLEEAGYADGFTFEAIVPTVPNITQLGEAVQAQLAEIGVKMTIRAVQPAQTADIFYVQQEGNALISPWGGRPDPSQTLGLLYGDEGFSNPGRDSTPELMAFINSALEVQPAEDRAKDLQAASGQVAKDALDVVLYFPVTPIVYTDKVIGVTAGVVGKPEFRGVGIAK